MDIPDRKRKHNDMENGPDSDRHHKSYRDEHPHSQHQRSRSSTTTSSNRVATSGRSDQHADAELALQRALAENQRLKQQETNCNEILAFVNRSWDSLNRQLQMIAVRLGNDKEQTFESMLPYILKSTDLQGEDANRRVGNLLEAMLSKDNVEQTLEPIWQMRAQDTRNVLVQVVDVLLKQRDAFEGLRTTVARSGAEGAISSDYERLLGEAAKAKAMVDTLHGDMSKIAARLTAALDELAMAARRDRDGAIAIEKSQQQCTDCKHIETIRELEGKVETLRERLKAKAMENVRAMYGGDSNKNDKALCSRCSSDMDTSGNNNSTTPTSTPASAPTNQNSNNTNLKIEGAPTPSQNTEELARITAISETRLEEISRLQNETKQLRQTIAQLQCAAAANGTTNVQLADEMAVRRSVLFQMSEDSLRRANEELAFRLAEIAKLHAAVAVANSEATEHISRLRSDHETRISELTNTVKEKDRALSKCRQQIEALQYKYEQRKASAVNFEGRFAEMSKIIAAQQAEIKRLREARHTKQNVEVLNSGAPVGGDSSSHISPHNAPSPLVSQELDKLRAEKHEWEKRENEMKAQLEVFRSRSTDMRDEVEIRLSEKSLQQKLEAVTKELESLKEQNSAMEGADALKEAQQAKENAQRERDLAQQGLEEILVELEQVAQTFETTQEQNVKLLTQLHEKDDANTKLMTDGLKSRQMYTLLREENGALRGKMDALEAQNIQQSELITQLQQQWRESQEKLERFESELHKATSTLTEARKLWREAEVMKQEADSKDRKFKHDMEEVERLQKKAAQEVTEWQDKLRKAQEQIAVLQTKLPKTAPSRSDTMSSLMEEELKDLKSKIRCPVCRTKERNTAIMKCGHVFCRDCVQQNLTSRNRKCPGCGRGFGESDLAPVYLS